MPETAVAAPTPDKPAEAITKADADKMVAEALTRAGVDNKALETRKAALAGERSRLDAEKQEWRKEQEDREEAAVRDKPDEFKALRDRRSLERRETEVTSKEEAQAAREAEFAERETRAASTSRTAQATAIAAEFKVAADALLKWTDGSEAAMRELAAQLPQIGQAGTTGLRPDSGRSSGGNRTQQQIMDAYIQNPTEETRKAYEAIRGS